MSGPKIVRIVTREEVMALCQLQLAGLDARIETWIGTGHRHGIISEADIAELMQRRGRLGKLLEDEEFLVLQKQIESEIEFLEQDMTDRLAKEVKRKREAKAASRRRKDAARQALAMLAAHDGEGATGLSEDLNAAIKGNADDEALNAAINRVMQHISADRSDEAALTDEQKQLAQALGDGSRTESVATWRETIDQQEEGRLAQIEQRISELELWASDADVSEFTQRFAALNDLPPEGRSSMQVDTLMIDLAAATAAAREAAVQLQALVVSKSELETMMESDTCRELAARIAVALESHDTSQADSMLAAAASLIAEETAKQAAAHRRQAILEGLARLGYEVREGMQTAFADGPVVLNNPATPGYGVEIGGPSSAERLQMRVVSYGGNDVSRDRDIEVQWCGDMDKLSGVLGEAGVTLAIERATAVGAVPVKVVEQADTPDAVVGSEAILQSRERTLRRF